jgi:hypothetical protein
LAGLAGAQYGLDGVLRQLAEVLKGGTVLTESIKEPTL